MTRAPFSAADVTLYVPYFNSAEHIGRCLDGILSQSSRPARLLLLDDASTPPASSLGAVAGSGAEIIRLETNIGLGASRNLVLERCRTRLLAALDSDVVAEPSWLERLLDALNRFPDAVGAAGRLDEIHQVELGDRWRAVHMKQHWGEEPLVNPRFLYGANNLFVADALRAVGAYHPSLKTNYEDMSLSERLLAKGAKLLYEPSARCGHLRRDGEASVLRGFWKWFHAKGLLQGDFDSPAGLMRRVDAVNFGIFDYRFALDEREGRPEFLKLDVLIPFLFCALDLELAKRRAGLELFEFPGAFLDEVPAPSRAILAAALPERGVCAGAEPEWAGEYVAKFAACLTRFSFREKAGKIV